MTESEQRKRSRMVVAAVVPVSVALAVGAYSFARTGQYLALAQSPWSVVIGLSLISSAMFLVAKADREQGWPRDTRLLLFLLALSSLLLGLASLLHAVGVPSFTLVEVATGVWVIRFAVHILSGLRLWRQKRDSPTP